MYKNDKVEKIDSKNVVLNKSELNSILEIDLELDRLNLDKHSNTNNNEYDINFQSHRLLSNNKKNRQVIDQDIQNQVGSDDLKINEKKFEFDLNEKEEEITKETIANPDEINIVKSTKTNLN